jgi:site-specific recombinase XerD
LESGEQRRLEALTFLSDNALWTIAREHMPEDRQARLHTLMTGNSQGVATNALAHNADAAKVQEWLGHVKVATTRIYDKRWSRPEESPTFKVEY